MTASTFKPVYYLLITALFCSTALFASHFSAGVLWNATHPNPPILGKRLSSLLLKRNEDRQWNEYNALFPKGAQVKEAMLASIRTSWEQGTAGNAVLEDETPQYAAYAYAPFPVDDDFDGSQLPAGALRFALSAAVRQAPDNRLSQVINDGLDQAALDGASAGHLTLLGTYTQPSWREYWQNATDRQLNYLLYTAPRTSAGAISMRNNAKQYWSDGVYMMPPFLAAYGAVTNNRTLLQMAYDNIRLYRAALLVNGPTGPLFAHIYDDDAGNFTDMGLWATGNGWAGLGMVRVWATILKSQFADDMKNQVNDLKTWVKQTLDGTFSALKSDNLLPDYISGGATFSDGSSSAALAATAYRATLLDPQMFGSNYTNTALQIAKAILSSVDELGVISPVVDTLKWGNIGLLSTEGQAFTLMMLSAWRDWLNASFN